MIKPPPTDAAHLPYRPCVGQFVVNRDGHVWIGCRADAGNEPEGKGAWWQMPQGGIDEGEDPRSAALRELFEETGMRSIEVIAEHPRWIEYDLPADLIGRAWGGRFRGQTQKWFALRFTGDDSEINIDPPAGAHGREFSAWRWAPVDEIVGLVVPFKRKVYEDVIGAFGKYAKPVAA